MLYVLKAIAECNIEDGTRVLMNDGFSSAFFFARGDFKINDDERGKRRLLISYNF